MAGHGNSIAKNTLFLYFRMLVTLCVTLYTSRVVIEALGITDYGIYNLVAGVSTSFVFFSSALSVSTQRFLNYEMGRGNSVRVGQIFSMSLEIFAVLAFVVLAVGIAVGDWLVSEKLVIPETKRSEAMVVLWAMTGSLCLMLVASVYESVLIARENMKIYAYLGIADALAKLGIAFAVMYLPHKLVTYAVLMVVAQLVPYCIMAIYCLRRYPESRPHLYWDKSTFMEMFGFTGWNIYGAVIWMVNEQGITVLLNLFFGPVVNAARGVATSVNNAINNFSTQFFTAVRPQLVKRYAAGHMDSLVSLIFGSTKFTAYLLWLLCFPVMLRADYILHMWLKEVPAWSAPFVVWTLIYTMVNSLCNPTYTALSASGRLRRAVLIGSNLFLLAFPLSYLALKCGLSPICVYPMLIAGRIAFYVVCIRELKRKVPVTFSAYLYRVWWHILKVLVLSVAIMFPLNCVVPQTFVGLIVVVVASLVSTAAITFMIGVTRTERTIIGERFRNLLSKFKK